MIIMTDEQAFEVWWRRRRFSVRHSEFITHAKIRSGADPRKHLRIDWNRLREREWMILEMLLQKYRRLKQCKS